MQRLIGDNHDSGMLRGEALTKQEAVEMLNDPGADLRGIDIMDAINNDGAKEIIDVAIRTTKRYTIRRLKLGGVLYGRLGHMTVIPSDIGLLFHLEELIIQAEPISKVPVTLGGLEMLRVLHLCRADLHTLPNELGNLNALMELNLNHNKLVTLPATFSRLINLIDLNVVTNRIDDVGAMEITNILVSCTKLMFVNLSWNQISGDGCKYLTSLISEKILPDLQCLYLVNNPGFIEDVHSQYHRAYDRVAFALRVKLAAARDLMTAKFQRKRPFINHVIRREMVGNDGPPEPKRRRLQASFKIMIL